MGLCRVAMRFGCVLGSRRSVAFSMVFGGSAMGLGRLLVLIGSFGMGSFRHVFSVGCVRLHLVIDRRWAALTVNTPGRRLFQTIYLDHVEAAVVRMLVDGLSLCPDQLRANARD